MAGESEGLGLRLEATASDAQVASNITTMVTKTFAIAIAIANSELPLHQNPNCDQP